jgi:hypothetical protein
LAVAAVARRLGIAPATLRTWDRRYGLGPAGHLPGRHRRYSADDVARLELMASALVRGVGPAEAARHALQARLPRPGQPAPAPGPPSSSGGAGPAPSAAQSPPPARVRVGGRTLRLPGAGPKARGIGRAALAMDSVAVRNLLAESIAAEGLVRSWETVVHPVLVALGDRWACTGSGVEVEHLVSDCVTAVYQAGTVAAEPSPGRRPVLLAGMPGELHVLGLTVLSAVLAERGVPCRPLGADLPADALRAAVRRTAPAALVLWSQMPGTADPGLLSTLPRTRPGFRTFVGGVGWDGADVPARVVWLHSLAEAADLLTTLVTA